MRLTAEQDRAVRSWQRGDVCVVAGPGSGKTRVLVERLRWLIVEREVPAERVLAITFTEKAAHEMRARLVAGSGVTAEEKALFDAAQVSTIDAFCNRLLRENALEAGVDPGFEILDEAEGRDLLLGAIERVLDGAFAGTDEAARAFLRSYAASGSRTAHGEQTVVQNDLAGLIRQIRTYGREPFVRAFEPPTADLSEALRGLSEATGASHLDALAGRLDRVPPGGGEALEAALRDASETMRGMRRSGPGKDLIAAIRDAILPDCLAAGAAAANRDARAWLERTVKRVLEEFGAAKLAAGRLDFDDVLARTAELLGSAHRPELRFEHVLIDEFQDTNPLQVQLVERLLDGHGTNRPVCFVVGDINQSIYGFRHADQNVFRQYRERLERGGGEVIRLLENFRSRPEVLDAVHRMLPGDAGSGVEAHRLASANRFPTKDGPSVEVRIVTQGGERAFEWEAAWLARRLRALRDGLRIADRQSTGLASRPLEWEDIAILVRTHERAARLAAALRRSGVPCRTGGARRLFQAPETAEMAAFLRVVRNPRDEISLAAVLKSPFCGVDDATLLHLKEDGRNLAAALAGRAERQGSPLGGQAARRLARFRALLETSRADRATLPARVVLSRAVTACGYRDFLAGREEGLEALANLDRLLEWIGRRERQGASGLDEISAALDEAIESGLPASEIREGERSGREVEILTMHAAKGLEFPVVALASLQQDARGPVPGMLFSAEHGIGARWRAPDGPEAVADTAYRLAAADATRREREEADRLLYVAMTRAEEHLLLSASFAGNAQKRHWCRALFDRLGIDARDDAGIEGEARAAGSLSYSYARASEPPQDQGASVDPAAAAGPAVLRPLPAAAQADYSAAVTSVTLFAQCPRKYFLSRYLGLETDGGPSLPEDGVPEGGHDRRDGADASTFGSEVHAFLAGEAEDARPAVRDLAGKFLEHDLGRRSAGADAVEKEMSFVFTVGDSLLRGTIDLLFEEGGERILVDYKTDRVPLRQVRQAAERYASQMQLYAAGLRRSGRPADRAVVFFLRHGAPVDIEIGDDAVAASKALVERFYDAQRRQQYPTVPGPHCRKCPHVNGPCPERYP